MWVFEETIRGKKLGAIINETRENVKYLPGIDLGPNVRAVPDLREAVEGASVLVLVTPHQFIHNVLEEVSGHVLPSAIAVSLTKGMEVRPEGATGVPMPSCQVKLAN